MDNTILVMIIILVLGSASYKLYKDRKNNVKCSGCPSCNMNEKCHPTKTIS